MPARRDGPGPSGGGRDRPSPGERPDKPLWGTTSGQTISRVLFVAGVLLLLWVAYVVITALG